MRDDRAGSFLDQPVIFMLLAHAEKWPSDIRHVDQQLSSARQHHSERIGDDPVGQLSLTNDLDVDDLRVGHEKATQHATRMIGGERLGLDEVVWNRHATTARPVVRAVSALRPRHRGLMLP